MYLVPVEVKKSSIDGMGVFALDKVRSGEVVWKFDKTHDRTLTVDEVASLTSEEKLAIDRIGYLSPITNRYVYPPEDDAARFTNHSLQNNLSVRVDKDVSEEPYFVANRDIEVGEELTNNYLEFDNGLSDLPFPTSNPQPPTPNLQLP